MAKPVQGVLKFPAGGSVGVGTNVAFDGVCHDSRPMNAHLELKFIHESKRITRIRGMEQVYTPHMTDYPDWQTFPNAMSGNQFTVSTATLPPGSYPIDIQPVSSFSSLAVVIVPTAGAGKLTVNHWVDPGGTVPAESDVFRFRPGAALVVRTPLRAPYVGLTIDSTGAGDLIASFWASLLASSSDRVTYPVTGQQAGIDTRPLAAGAVDQWRMPAINAGPALLAFAPADTSGKLKVEVIATDELDSPMYHIMFPLTPTAAIHQALQLPGEITVVQVTNTDGVASHTYGVSLICPP